MTTTSAAPAAPPDAGGPPPVRRTRRRSPFPYALLAPSLVVLTVLVAWPLVQLVVTSFQNYGREQAFGAPATWAGLGNYRALLADPGFYAVLVRSFLFMVVAVALTISIGTLVALLLARLGRPLRFLLSVGLLLAWAMPPLSAVMVWGWMFDTQYGVVNHVLSRVTGESWRGHSWLLDPLSFFMVLGIIIVWGAVPFVAFSMYAGLTQVPGEVLEAAQIDGANARQRFFRIQVPYVRQILVILTVLSVIWDLRVFAQVYALQGIGGLYEDTSTLGVWIYQVGTASGDYGMSAAAAIVMVVIMLAVSAYYVRETLKEEED